MKTRTAATAALTLATALVLAGCAGTSDSGSMAGMDHRVSSSSTPSSSAVTADFNDADVMFAHMMIPHHQQAVEMSDVLLAKDGINEQVVALAEQIKAAQEPEITQLENWLEAWGADVGSMEDMDHGGGMMTDDDMRALEDATRVEASRLFLEQMTMHHEGAIEMAQDEVDNGQNPEAVEMAQTIIDTQTAEIATMKEILASL